MKYVRGEIEVMGVKCTFVVINERSAEIESWKCYIRLSKVLTY